METRCQPPLCQCHRPACPVQGLEGPPGRARQERHGTGCLRGKWWRQDWKHWVLPFSVQYCHMCVCVFMVSAYSQAQLGNRSGPVLSLSSPTSVLFISQAFQSLETTKRFGEHGLQKRIPGKSLVEMQENAGEKAPSNVSRRSPKTTSVYSGGK